jgi:hypothetical protein
MDQKTLGGALVPILPEAAKAYVGIESEVQIACDAIERGAVRRYAQAIMDEDPIYDAHCERNATYGGPVAPPIFPTHLFRRPFGDPDPFEENAANPDYDGSKPAALGLPEIEPLNGLALLAGGSELEFIRYARHGERLKLRSRYASITEKETSKGPIILVVTETDYLTEDDELLLRSRKTTIRRKP